MSTFRGQIRRGAGFGTLRSNGFRSGGGQDARHKPPDINKSARSIERLGLFCIYLWRKSYRLMALTRFKHLRRVDKTVLVNVISPPYIRSNYRMRNRAEVDVQTALLTPLREVGQRHSLSD